MTDTILAEFQNSIDGVELIPSGKGTFEISFDDELVFSKKQQHRFPEDDEVLGPLRARV